MPRPLQPLEYIAWWLMMLVVTQWLLHYVARTSGRDLRAWPIEVVDYEHRRGVGAGLGRLLFVLMALILQLLQIVGILRYGADPLIIVTTALGWSITAVNIVRYWRAPRVPDP